MMDSQIVIDGVGFGAPPAPSTLGTIYIDYYVEYKGRKYVP